MLKHLVAGHRPAALAVIRISPPTTTKMTWWSQRVNELTGASRRGCAADSGRLGDAVDQTWLVDQIYRFCVHGRACPGARLITTTAGLEAWEGETRA